MKYVRYYIQEPGSRLIKLKNQSCWIDDELVYYKILEHGYKSKKPGAKKMVLIKEV